MRRRLFGFFESAKNRQIVGFFGGGAAVMLAGIWTVLIYFFPHTGNPPEPRGVTVVTQSGALSSGRDTIINGPVTLDLMSGELVCT